MRKISIAVCDSDQAYGEKLGEWISLERKEGLLGCCFSSPEHFLEYQKNQEQDIILLGTGFWENPEIIKQIKEQKEREQKKPDENKILWMCLYDGAGKEKIPELMQELPVIEKYQPASGILREIFSCYQNYGERDKELVRGHRELIGVYSPGHSIWQTPFSLILAQVLGQKERVLYVNLKECAGFTEWFQEEYQRDLLDVMYISLTSDVHFSDCVRSAVYHMEGFDYIPPAEDGGCLGEISRQDYLKFTGFLAEESGYDVVIMDFGMMIPGFFELLRECSKVYIPSEQGALQEGFRQQFCRMVSRQGNLELKEKISYLSLPRMSENFCQGEQWMQQWMWGELGDYTRKLVGVQRGTD